MLRSKLTQPAPGTWSLLLHSPSSPPSHATISYKDGQPEGCELSFIWSKMRTAALETAPQIALRHCSKGVVWGCRIVWCTLTSWYLVSLLPVSIVHVSDILLVGFWSWGISFIMWGCQGWGWQAARTWVSVSCEMVGFPAPIGWPGASQSICTQ